MTTVHGCNLPEDVYYLIEKHVWAKPAEGGVIRVGMTAVAVKLSGGKLAAVTIRKKNLGQPVAQGKSVATVESSKYVGPVASPLSGTLLRGNDKLETDPNLAVSDPYGEGWIAEIQPGAWDTEKGGLVTGADGVAKYQAKLEADGISCE
jgi:glycine cleavage system H protein